MENSRSNISDDQLDDLFRRSAEELNVEFDAASWQKLNQRLDDAGMPAGNSRSWREWTLLPIILLLFLSSSYWYVSSGEKSFVEHQQKNKVTQGNISSKEANDLSTKPNASEIVKASESGDYEKRKLKNDSESEKISGASSEKNNIDKEKLILANEEKSSNNLNKLNETSSQENGKKSVAESRKVDEKTIGSDKNKISRNETINTSKISISKKTTLNQGNDKSNVASQSYVTLRNDSKKGQRDVLKNYSENSSKSRANDAEIVQQSLIIPQKKNGNADSKATNLSKKNQDDLAILNSQQVYNQGVAIKNDISETNSSVTSEVIERWQMRDMNLFLSKQTRFQNSLKLPEIPSNDSPEIEQVGSVNDTGNSIFRKGFSMRLLYSPDLSTILPNNITKVGSNVGLLLEYRFSKRWSINAGVIKSLKVYSATGEQYSINLNWNVGVAPTGVEATCKMLDIPLNIRYDITQKPHSRWFATTGLTSYMILNEDYQYSYAMHVNGVHYNWNGNTGNYFASNVNLSLGYEKQIFKKISWQIEPFARIPIKYVGYGKVKLVTFGTFISVKYRF